MGDRSAPVTERNDVAASFQLLVESVEDYAIFVLDPTGHVATWNRGAERIKGYRADEILGQHFSRFYPEEDVRAGKCERELEGATRNGRFEDEGWRLRKDGSRFWANVVITALRDARGELVGFAKVTRDLTAQRAAELERIRLAQAEEAIRLRDEFLSIASHELRTPLTALNLQVESLLMAGRTLDAKVTGKLQRIERTGHRLKSLVALMLDASRIATGRFNLNPVRADLVATTREVIDRFAEHAADAGCTVTLDTRVESIAGAWDVVRLEQALTNVLENAFKYAPGTPVHVNIEATDRFATVTVDDEGPGIPAAALGRIFERFERAAPKLNYGGLGLGLYVAREILAAHGGAISAENRPSHGARFTLRLPITADGAVD
jgi:PAS domain S-box-containing protein